MEQKKGNENKVVSQVDQESNIDVSLIEYNLSLSEEERLINHQRALDTVNELIKARKQIYGE
ncbi:MAG: hypothetical protein AABY64_02830 [Bdellovibrionota bacterium]